MTRRGHTLLELLVALSILGTVGAAAQGILRRGLVHYRDRESSLQAEQSGRIALAAVTLELGELAAADSSGGDLLEIASSSLTYRSMMNMHFVCQAADVASGRLTVFEDPWVGSQQLDPSNDLVLVRSGDRWISSSFHGLAVGHDCPGGRGSISFLLDSFSRAALEQITPGSPVRGYRVTRIRSYLDGDGVTWLGMQSRAPAGNWAATQPIAGPLAPNGLVLSYGSRSGGIAADPAAVDRIVVRLVASRSNDSGPAIEGEVWLRNNPRSP